MKTSLSFHRFKHSLLFSVTIFINTCISQNLIINGDFSAGNTGFTTTDIYCNTANCLAPYVNNAYSIGPNPNFFHPSFSGSDHTTGTGNMMIVNGGLFSDIAWSQNVSVASNSTFSFSAWASSIYTINTAALGFSINGVSQGSISAPATLNTWQPFSAVWNSGSATTASIVIRALNTSVPLSQNGIDFGLDDIALQHSNQITSIVPQGDLINAIMVYPNPTTNKFQIETKGSCTVSLQDITGHKLEESIFIHGNGELEMKHYPSGIYFLVITINDIQKCMKVVKTD